MKKELCAIGLCGLMMLTTAGCFKAPNLDYDKMQESVNSQIDDAMKQLENAIGGSEKEAETKKTKAPEKQSTTITAATSEEATAFDFEASEDYQAAFKEAQQYADLEMSKQWILDYLTDETRDKLKLDTPTYPEIIVSKALENVKADWKNNALKSAKGMRESSVDYSDSEIEEHLLNTSKFTPDEVKYAMDHIND